MSAVSRRNRRNIKRNKQMRKEKRYAWGKFVLEQKTLGNLNFNGKVKLLGRYAKELIDSNRYGKQGAFIYFWVNLAEEKIYVGKHVGTDDDGYLTSGQSVLKDLAKQPQNMRRFTVVHCNKKRAINLENQLIELAHLIFEDKVYNNTKKVSANKFAEQISIIESQQ